MSHDGNVDVKYNNTDFSSGDSNKMNKKPNYQEVNNNEVDELSSGLEMGCIVDTVKRPPNICVETCVYEDGDTRGSDGEDGYSDEFEDDKSEGSIKTESQPKNETSRIDNPSFVKLSKSNSTMSSRPPVSMSGRSSDVGSSISTKSARRVNMSFTNDRVREIERHNHILLNKILSAKNTRKCSFPLREEPRRPVAPAAVHRKMQQRKIDYENMILLKKIQRAKSTTVQPRR